MRYPVPSNTVGPDTSVVLVLGHPRRSGVGIDVQSRITIRAEKSIPTHIIMRRISGACPMCSESQLRGHLVEEQCRNISTRWNLKAYLPRHCRQYESTDRSSESTYKITTDILLLYQLPDLAVSSNESSPFSPLTSSHPTWAISSLCLSSSRLMRPNSF
jgi:hypothetical protein